MGTPFLSASLLFIGMICAASAARAADYYVSPTGTATWTQCANIATPCSWQTAMANVAAGDRVYFRGGTYDVGIPGAVYEIPAMNPGRSGTSGNPISFVAYPNETPIITGSMSATSRGAFFGCGYRDHVIWDGFTASLLDRSNYQDVEVQLVGFWNSDHCVIRNSDLRGFLQTTHHNASLIRLEHTTYATVENNVLHDMNAYLPTDLEFVEPQVNTAATMSFDAANTVFRNNTLYNNLIGFYVKYGDSNVTYHRNLIYGGANYERCAKGFFFTNDSRKPDEINNAVYQNIVINCNAGVEFMLGNPSDVRDYSVYNNTIAGAGYNVANIASNSFGIQVSDSTAGVNVHNNIVYSKAPYVRYYTSGSGLPAYSNYNCFYGTSYWNLDWTTNYSSLSAWTAATGFDTNSITSDPLLVNAGGTNPQDYKLQASSPARTGGRGGAYATVLGAYITGDEVIGYSPTYVPDTLAPAAPSNLTVQ